MYFSFKAAFDTVEVYSLSSGLWRYGPTLPDAITDATMLSIQEKDDDTNSLVFAGGYSYVNG